MIHYPSRRDVVKMAAGLTAVSSSSVDPRGAFAYVERMAPLEGRMVSKIDMILRAATSAGEVPGVVALAATDNGILYEGHFGRRRLGDGPTEFETIAGMAKCQENVKGTMPV